MKKKINPNHEIFSLPSQLKLVCACISALIIPVAYWFRLHEIVSGPQLIVDFVNTKTSGNNQLNTSTIETTLRPLLILIGIVASFSLYRFLIAVVHWLNRLFSPA